MGSRPAKFTQADVARVLKAAKCLGMGVRVNLQTGVVEIAEGIVSNTPAPAPEAAEPERVLIG